MFYAPHTPFLHFGSSRLSSWKLIEPSEFGGCAAAQFTRRLLPPFVSISARILSFVPSLFLGNTKEACLVFPPYGCPASSDPDIWIFPSKLSRIRRNTSGTPATPSLDTATITSSVSYRFRCQIQAGRTRHPRGLGR